MYPVLVNIGFVNVYSFGFFMLLALLVGFFYFWREARKDESDSDTIIDCGLAMIVGALVGGRLGYILLHPMLFWPNVWQIFNIFSGGFVFYGALVGGIIACVWYTRNHGLSTRRYLDIAALSTTLAHAVGLVGAFLSGTAYGVVTQMPWGVAMFGVTGKRQPVQLFEAALELTLFFFLLRIRKRHHQPGYVIVWYIILYGTSRIFIEFLRGDSVYWFVFKSQWLISLAAICLAILYWKRKLQKPLRVPTPQRSLSNEI